MNISIFSILILNYESYAPTNQNLKYNQSTQYELQKHIINNK
jgi:hypothetical protein